MDNPAQDNDLVKRLRRKEQRYPAQGGGSIGVDGKGKVTSSSYITDDGYRLVNPDGPEAADERLRTKAPPPEAEMVERFYIDCEFDGHGGPLLSIAMVREDGYGMHVSTTADAHDPWVIQNVLPLMQQHSAELHATAQPNEVGHWLRAFLSETPRPVIVADSPVDIGRFCQALSTDSDGSWCSTGFPQMTFEVHNVDCYPTALEGAVQHNAYWDAMALRHKLARAALSSLGQLRMREALEPFAKAADYYDEKFSDWGESEGPYLDTMVAGPAGIKVEHYRKARQALAEEATEQARTGGEIKG